MSETRDPYDDQLRSARYKAERDQARQECERLQRKVECLGDDIENLKLELGEAKDRLRDSVPRDAYESRRTKWLRQIRECEEALHRRREYIKKLENAALERRTVRAEDREAAEWVRDHGGLDAVETRWDNDTQLADAVIYALWPYGMPDGGGNEDVMDELSKRLMPSGCEWPRFEDGARVKFGDVVSDGDETGRVYYVTFDAVNPVIIGFTDETPDQDPGTWLEVSVSDGKRVKRPAPKVLDADGVEIRVGDEVWDVETGCKRTVRAVNDNETVEFDGYENRGWFSKFLTHRAPVFAADGKPLREGETVYHVDTGIEYSVRSVTNGGAHLSKGDKPGGYCRADYLTHQRPVLDADGAPIKVGDMVWYRTGAARGVVESIDANSILPLVVYRGDNGELYRDASKDLTHTKPEPPDSWERLEADADKYPCEYFGIDNGSSCRQCPAYLKESPNGGRAIGCRFEQKRDLVRRCKALAERWQ